MKAETKNDQAEIEAFLAGSEAFETLSTLAAVTSPEDQDYIAEPINRLLSEPGGLDVLQARMRDFMDPEQTLPEVSSYVLSNRNVRPVPLGTTTPAFQDMVMRLRQLSESGNKGLATAAMFYAVGMAHYEWKDRQRPSVPYDPERDDPISLAYRSPED
ncbi:MAG: hypothetical protein KDI90_09610 [Alphaproteobacteria bacterium]|nr:hypothetical protein [Alphaproteobacteria bacterium]MCB9975673.1 hypothetical protein [Rhodospirillales bacterium]